MKFGITLLPLAISVLAGALVTVQAGFNAQIGRTLGHPLWATLISFLVGLAGILAVMAALRVPQPIWNGFSTLPWWIYLCGGLFGAFYVTSAVMFAPKLGAAAFMAAVVVGQMVCSLTLDHFALAGFSERSLSWPRLLGALLMIAGLLLLQTSPDRAAGAADTTPVPMAPTSVP